MQSLTTKSAPAVPLSTLLRAKLLFRRKLNVTQRCPPKVLAPDGLQLFRASTPAGRLDWVAALAIVSTSHDLGVWKPPQPSAAAAISSAAANGEDCSSVSGSKNNDLNPPRRRWSLSYRRRCDSDVRGQSQDEQEEEEDNEGVSGETEAVGERISANGGGENGVTAAGRGAVAAAPRMVMQGFLRKRIAGRMWGASEEWEYRWIVLRVSRKRAEVIDIGGHDPYRVICGRLWHRPPFPVMGTAICGVMIAFGLFLHGRVAQPALLVLFSGAHTNIV